ncbi:MAG TPA: ABC-2 family transporter protein [Polyangia bacterium]|nr:ABC-2 family transporter protein [Polyangia bacterium]
MSLRRALRAYPTLLRIGLAEAVAYRAEFLVWMLSMTMPLVMLALMKTMADEAPVGRFTAATFVSYYLATLIVRQMSGAWVVWELIREIREGTLALRLLRPIHPLLGHSADSLAALPMRALVSLPVAVILLVTTGGSRVSHDPVVLACFVASLFGAWLLNFAVSAMIGTLGLYLESSISIWELWLGCFMLFSGYLLPLELFPHWLERLARVLPFAYLQAVPVEMLTGLHTRASALRALAWQWTYAAAAVTAMLLLWRRAVKRFAAYGG